MTPTICLNMIVKNEAHIIQRCLKSIKPWIDSWVIVDTGSNDGTQEIAAQFLNDIPGKIVERPWVDFAHNRNEALEYSRAFGNYSLFIDADEQFIPYSGLKKLPTKKDCYFIKINEERSIHRRAFLLKNSRNVHWEGVLHECLYSDEKQDEEFFQEGEILSLSRDGNRSRDPEKYLKDAAVLEKALEKDPKNQRYQFFLAQSYKNANSLNLALKAYQKRFEMGGDPEEVFFSLFMVGCVQDSLGLDPKIPAETFIKAHRLRPHRPEPIYGLSLYYMKQSRFQEAYDMIKKVIDIPFLEDCVFLQTHIRDHLIPYLFINSCFHLNKYTECFSYGNKLLSDPLFPDHLKEKTIYLLKELQNNLSPLELSI